MSKLSFMVALITKENDYQQEQSAAALEAARNCDVAVEIVYAENDAVNQSQQVVKAIQGGTRRPDAILMEPVGTAMEQAALAAAAAGIGWGILNREVEYVSRLRLRGSAPIFAVTTDQEEVGKIQSSQFAAFLRKGGSILYLEGPSTAESAVRRSAGMNSNRPPTINPKILKGDWTEQSGYRAIKSWLSLSTSRDLHVSLVGCQNDAMALGARRAFEEVADIQSRHSWLELPFTGCDGVPKTGQAHVRQGVLAATVVIPPTMGLAVEIMAKAFRSGIQPALRTLSAVRSFPTIEDIKAKQR